MNKHVRRNIAVIAAAGMLVAAFVYASVGHGGASAYLAAMALAACAPVAALTCVLRKPSSAASCVFTVPATQPAEPLTGQSEFRRPLERQPDVRHVETAGPVEPLGHHADDCGTPPVDRHGQAGEVSAGSAILARICLSSSAVMT